MKFKKIAIVGHYGARENFTDGQTVKIRSLVSAIKKTRPDIILTVVDTYYISNGNWLLFSWQLFKSILVNRHIIFFPAFRGRQYMFCFFYYIGKILKKKLYHDCIAGSLDQELLEHPAWIKYLNSFTCNWMESPEQVEILKQMGVKNVYYLPNFKNLTPTSIPKDIDANIQQFRFCMFSRVLPNKGIEDALEAVHYVIERRKANIIVDIYGPVEHCHEKWFEVVKDKYSNICNYCGVIPYDKSVETLKNYFALLFPTRYYTEGMPGTIIDAMFAGIPVIARRWAWCDNMITNGFNGISYEFDKPEYLKDILTMVIDNPHIILSMKANCIEQSNKYSPSIVCQQIFNAMNI